MKVSKNELKDILGISLEGLKTIEKRKQLKTRLNDLGYKFINKEKIKRNVYYELVQINENKELASNICNYVFDTKNIDRFTDYFVERTEKSRLNIPASLEYISEKINVNPSTVRRWDLKLLDKKIISNDGFFYFKLNKKEGAIEEVTKEEFNSFWRRREVLKHYNRLQNRYLNGEITFNEALQISNDATALRIELGEQYLYRTKRYKLNQDNVLYSDFIKLLDR